MNVSETIITNTVIDCKMIVTWKGMAPFHAACDKKLAME